MLRYRKSSETEGLVKRKSVERKPGMRKRSQSQLEAELAAAIVRRIELRIRNQGIDVREQHGETSR